MGTLLKYGALIGVGVIIGMLTLVGYSRNRAPSSVVEEPPVTQEQGTDTIDALSEQVAPIAPPSVAPAPQAVGPSLDLSQRGLTKVPNEVFGRTDLVSLDLSHNNLTGALQAEVRHLSKLERLDLSHNQFTGVPAEVGQLSRLRYLDLSYNQLTGLPYELGNLHNLEVLDLTGNEYSRADLAKITEGLPPTVEILGQ